MDLALKAASKANLPKATDKAYPMASFKAPQALSSLEDLPDISVAV